LKRFLCSSVWIITGTAIVIMFMKSTTQEVEVIIDTRRTQYPQQHKVPENLA